MLANSNSLPLKRNREFCLKSRRVIEARGRGIDRNALKHLFDLIEEIMEGLGIQETLEGLLNAHITGLNNSIEIKKDKANPVTDRGGP
jgi:hypothetical protein